MKLALKTVLTLIVLSFLSYQCNSSKNSKQAAASSSKEGDMKTLIVASEVVDCSGVGKMKCLQVKENIEDNWELFYTGIEGFNHEPGYEYVLEVKVDTLQNVPADASSLKYTLVKEVSKTKKK
ncbi:MAG: DUF4377 domain-containing protein [Bergeyella sp.]|nr:DUF4377 domain-containing protein [Bergeyella sp.]